LFFEGLSDIRRFAFLAHAEFALKKQAGNPFADGLTQIYERMGYTSCKDNLMAYSMFKLILFGTSTCLHFWIGNVS
jgi:hypothetical protein